MNAVHDIPGYFETVARSNLCSISPQVSLKDHASMIGGQRAKVDTEETGYDENPAT